MAVCLAVEGIHGRRATSLTAEKTTAAPRREFGAASAKNIKNEEAEGYRESTS